MATELDIGNGNVSKALDSTPGPRRKVVGGSGCHASSGDARTFPRQPHLGPAHPLLARAQPTLQLAARSLPSSQIPVQPIHCPLILGCLLSAGRTVPSRPFHPAGPPRAVWTAQGFLGFRWVCLGFAQGLPRVCPGFAQGLPRVCPGFSQGFPMVFLGFS